MTTTAPAPRRSATRTREIILTALAEATEPVTVTELAEAAGVGKSTLAKHLPTLEKDGLAVRTPGGREGRRRLPDTWQANSTTPEEASVRDAAPQEDDHTEEEADTASAPAPGDAPEVAAPTFAPTTQDTRPQTTSEQAPVAEAAPADDQSPPLTSAPAPPAPPRPAFAPAGVVTATATRVGVTTAEEVNPISGNTRLAPGELKLMVKAILDAEPGEEFTATAISHLLQGRSIGAIQNNLARLAKEERAVQTCDRPRRYRSAKHPA
ncbi:winged helix-turn-helix domain-containing protein [Nocardiopsis sp. FR6]|uniref:winged helix-turn-helix domain-containing protein n=1 Tax=Nocardiopsis sp. FR6 TaxID=2605986 RepID=UPI00135705A1|nr:winged helix-turn-helix domain-containing protein [Nocardiopsis sp. FR6]